MVDDIPRERWRARHDPDLDFCGSKWSLKKIFTFQNMYEFMLGTGEAECSHSYSHNTLFHHTDTPTLLHTVDYLSGASLDRLVFTILPFFFFLLISCGTSFLKTAARMPSRCLPTPTLRTAFQQEAEAIPTKASSLSVKNPTSNSRTWGAQLASGKPPDVVYD